MKGRRVSSIEEIERPGDYCGLQGEENSDRSVWFLLPIADPDDPFNRGEYDPDRSPEENRAEWVAHRNNGLHRVAEPPWVFRECPDGSLEIRESILVGVGDADGYVWHGYLNEGHEWRTV